MMIKVGIIGATGYAGGELVRILMGHKDAEIVWYGSRSYVDQKYADVYRNMFQIVDAKCMDDNMDELAACITGCSNNSDLNHRSQVLSFTISMGANRSSLGIAYLLYCGNVLPQSFLLIIYHFNRDVKYFLKLNV